MNECTFDLLRAYVGCIFLTFKTILEIKGVF